MVQLKNPEALATDRQKFRIHQLTGEDTKDLDMTMQQASNKIEELELDVLENDLPQNNNDIPIGEQTPFTEAHVTIVTGDQRGGKTTYAIGKIVDSYKKDCVSIYCQKVLNLDCQVKAYYDDKRVAKIKAGKTLKYIYIPQSYKLYSPMRIFTNLHIYGIPCEYIPSFRHMLHGLKTGHISNGWLLADEAHRGMSARNGMSSMGKDWVGEYFQFGKSHLDVMLLTHFPRMIDYLARLVPTIFVHCRYDPKTYKVIYTMRKKGEQGEKEHSFYAPQYFKYFRTDEKVNA